MVTQSNENVTLYHISSLIHLVFQSYFGYKFVNKTEFVPLNEADLNMDNINFSGQEFYDEDTKTGWRKTIFRVVNQLFFRPQSVILDLLL